MIWRDVVKKYLQRMGITREEVEASAQDRHSWRQRMKSSQGPGKVTGEDIRLKEHGHLVTRGTPGSGLPARHYAILIHC